MLKMVMLFLTINSNMALCMNHADANGHVNGVGNGHQGGKILSYNLFVKVKKICAVITDALEQANNEGRISMYEPVFHEPRYAFGQMKQGLLIEYQSGIPKELKTPWGMIQLTRAFNGDLACVHEKLLEMVTISRLQQQNPVGWEPGETFVVETFQGVPLDEPLPADPDHYLPANEVAVAWRQLQERYNKENE